MSLTRIAFVAHDGLSTVIFASWYAGEFRRRPDVRFFTISSRDIYAGEVDALGSEHIEVFTERFISPLHDARYWWTLYRTFRRERFDVVVTFGTKPNIFGPLAARLAGTRRVIVAVRGLGRAFNPAPSPGGRLMAWLMRQLYRAACRCADRVWFTNVHDRDYMVSAGLVPAERTFLTANSVNPSYFSADQIPPATIDALRREVGIAQGDLVVIMVARMIWLKGIAEFVAAARAIRAKRRNVRFLLVAPMEEGSPQAVPAEYMKEAEAAGDVVWLRFRKDVRELYQLADVAVLPSYYKEGGYPRALLEPMALAKPVIAADTPECRGPVEPERNGFLVPPRDSAALAERIEQLLSDEAMRIRFGRRSRDIVLERFADGIVGRTVLDEIGVGA
jgi:glycosyltransferase involved in cell wall biosynthesis